MVSLHGCRRAVLLAICLALGSSVRAETPEELFERGNTAYAAGQFLEAATAYREVLRYGVEDARLEYNLGNAEFRLGNLGPAMVHFERARRLEPTDPDIEANLEYARTFCFDRVELQSRTAFMGWLEKLQDRLGPDTQAWAALALLWIIAGLVAWGLARPGGFGAAHGWSVTGLALALIVVVGSWYMTHERLEGRQIAVVLRENVEVLAGPGLNNATLFTVHEGLVLEVRAERVEWLHVSLPNGLNGWIDRSALEIV